MAKDARPDGLAPGRQFVDDGHVKVSINGHGQGAGDRGGSHHQDVGVQGFLTQLPSLEHAEFVLLIHHHDSQLGELHVLFQQRVRPHDELHVTRGDARQRGGPLLRRRSTGQEGDGHVKRVQVRTDGQHVLFRQNLGRSHQGGLIPVPASPQHRMQGHDGLARPYVALEQPVHGPGRVHIRFNLGKHPLLGIRKLKGQVLLQRHGVRPGEPEGNAG